MDFFTISVLAFGMYCLLAMISTLPFAYYLDSRIQCSEKKFRFKRHDAINKVFCE